MDKKRGAKHFLPTLKRVLSFLFSFYPVLLPVTILCILLNAAVSAIPSVFQQKILSLIEKSWRGTGRGLPPRSFDGS